MEVSRVCDFTYVRLLFDNMSIQFVLLLMTFSIILMKSLFGKSVWSFPKQPSYIVYELD